MVDRFPSDSIFVANKVVAADTVDVVEATVEAMVEVVVAKRLSP